MKKKRDDMEREKSMLRVSLVFLIIRKFLDQK